MISRRPVFLFGMLCALFASRSAYADLLAQINETRRQGCSGERPAARDVRANRALDDVARDLSQGARLGDAIDRSPYPAAVSTSLHVEGPREDEQIGALLEKLYCRALNDPRYTDAGIYRRGDVTWVVLAARVETPAIENSGAIAARVLELVNAARAEPRRCGVKFFEAAPPLKPSRALTEAASAHARDMAEHGSLDHRGSDDSSPAERITRAGYPWRATGENIAAGQATAEEVVAGWLDSPGHCANIMRSEFTEMGVAFAGTYWAQEFAAPR